MNSPVQDLMLAATRLLSLLRLLFYLLFFFLPKTYLLNSWRYSWKQCRLRFGTENSWGPKSAHLRPRPWRPIPENFTWTPTIFVSNVKVILRYQAPQRWIIPCLPPHFSMALSALGRFSTSATTKVPLQSHGQSSKPFSEKTLGTPKPLLIAFGLSLEGTPNTNWKKLKTTSPIFNISNSS